jgi:DNA modification methylase
MKKKKGLFELYNPDEEPKPRTPQVLAKAREIREDFISKFGLIPTSILVNNRQDRAIDLAVGGGRDYRTIGVKGLSKKEDIDITTLNPEEIRAYDVLHRGAQKGALSRFPQNIARILIKFYCPEKGLIFDPFAGHASRMQVVYETNRSYVGVDISHEFMQYNYQLRDFLLNQKRLIPNDSTITLIEGSSDKVDLPDNCADFTITSPPYGSTEWYGDEPDQLGIKYKNNYEGFIQGLKNHVVENYRILKPDSFCIWNVNDFVTERKFRPYHIDVCRIFQEVGFELFTIYIMDLGTPIGQAFVQSIVKSKRFPKRHEYLLIFKKPK